MNRRPATIEDAVGWGCVVLVLLMVAIGVAAIFGSVWVAGH